MPPRSCFGRAPAFGIIKPAHPDLRRLVLPVSCLTAPREASGLVGGGSRHRGPRLCVPLCPPRSPKTGYVPGPPPGLICMRGQSPVTGWPEAWCQWGVTSQSRAQRHFGDSLLPRLPCPHAPMGPTLSAPPPPRPPPSTLPPPGRHRSIRPRGTGTGSREHRPTQALGTAGPQRPRTGWLGLGSGLAHLGASRGLFQSCRGGDAPGPLPWAGVSSSLECSTLFEHVFVMFV